MSELHEESGKSQNEPKIVALTCNWEAYSALESAGARRNGYPSGVRVLRLPCLGSVGVSQILEAFRLGADGVLLLGCPEGKCHYETGNVLAEKAFRETAELLETAGVAAHRLEFYRMPFDGTENLVRVLRAFEQRLRSSHETFVGSEVDQP